MLFLVILIEFVLYIVNTRGSQSVLVKADKQLFIERYQLCNFVLT